MFLYRHRAIPYLNLAKATAGSSAPGGLALVDGTLSISQSVVRYRSNDS